jgi:hypothetical protein
MVNGRGGLEHDDKRLRKPEARVWSPHMVVFATSTSRLGKDRALGGDLGACRRTSRSPALRKEVKVLKPLQTAQLASFPADIVCICSHDASPAAPHVGQPVTKRFVPLPEGIRTDVPPVSLASTVADVPKIRAAQFAKEQREAPEWSTSGTT